MNETILFVDDDIRIVSALQRSLHKDYEVEIAGGPNDALDAIREAPYAVVVSDLKMPGMNGVEFLTRVKQLAPETIRVLLTGQADLDTAVAAVNDGHVFRFLTKPCPQPVLVSTLDAALAQYRLVCVEKCLFQETLIHTIGILMEILTAAQPAVFGRTFRIRRIVRELAGELDMADWWELEAAALLSQIGCISVDPEVLQKYFAAEELLADEKLQVLGHAAFASKLLQRVQRLGTVARMVEHQMDSFPEACALRPDTLQAATGSQILRVALDFDRLTGARLSVEQVVAEMWHNDLEYNPQVLDALDRVKDRLSQIGTPSDSCDDFGMVLRPLTDQVVRSLRG